VDEIERAAWLVVDADARLRERLETLAHGARMVFFAGLPGTGKSLLVHQLAHLAAAAGRAIHLLQWDVARPVFEASDAGRRYPVVDGVTHGVIRRAVGLWARRALVEWNRQYPGLTDLLIGETPFIGHRLIELARPAEDAAELLLSASACRFVIPVPSREVRGFIEAERERRGAHRLHERELEDAPPPVLRDLWHQLGRVARELGVAGPSPDGAAPDSGPPYDPTVYQRVYEALLPRRRVEAIALDTVLPTATFSVYEFAIVPRDLTPAPDEASAFVRAVEARYPDPDVLAREIDRWWLV
jgi:hypothetical protein